MEAAEGETLKSVPLELKHLVQLVARAFYQSEHIVILDALIRHPCVKEEDLIEVLLLEPKQLRQSLHFLKKDKLIKSITRNETEEGRSYRKSYIYINYQLFVNVVRYKLDKMRKAAEAEERQVQNRMSYVCPQCEKSFSDLEIDRLLDPMEGILRCSYCGTALKEDALEVSPEMKSRLPRLNEQLVPIMDLLKKVDGIKLDNALLEPDPDQVARKLGDLKKSSAGARSPTKGEKWAATKGPYLYKDNAAVTVNIGEEGDTSKNKLPAKEQPQWLRESTVAPYDEALGTAETLSPTSHLLSPQGLPTPNTSQSIMADLLVHEQQKPKGVLPSGPYEGEDNEEDSESSTSEDEPTTSFMKPSELMEGDSDLEEDEEEDEFTMRVGDELYSVHEINEDQNIVSRMTEEEKRLYSELSSKYYSQYYGT